MNCFKQYTEQAKRTVNPLLTDREKLMNALFGLSGETGEVMDYFKKYFYHEHEFDKDIVIDELGDVFWYISQLMDVLDIELSEVLKRNIEKLEKRYPEGFSKKSSIFREENKNSGDNRPGWLTDSETY